VKILEDNLDQSIMREEENLNLDKIGKDGSNDGSEIEQLKKILKEQRLKFDVRFSLFSRAQNNLMIAP
jgi:hypothetical protein